MAEYATFPYFPQPNIDCQSLLQKCSYSGWLRKYSFRNKLKIFDWPQVYVVLSSGCVYYYGSEYAKKSHSFSLYGYNHIMRDSEMEGALWVFKLIHTHSEYKTYYFSASSEQEMKDWMKSIKHGMNIANNKKAKRNRGDGKSFDDVSLTYQDIEEKIYDDPAALILPKNYKNKRKSEADSDDDMDGRPPIPPPIPERNTTERTVRRTRGETSNISKAYTKPSKQDDKTALQSNLKKQLKVTDKEVKPDAPKRTRGDGASIVRDKPVEEVVETITQEDYWGSIYFVEGDDKAEATELIRKIAETGVYLVKECKDGTYTLHFFAVNMPSKMKIQYEDDKYFITQKFKAESIEELVYYYYENCIPTSTFNVKLETPYKLHPKYKSVCQKTVL